MSQLYITPEREQCLRDCTECHEVCLNTASVHCLEMGGKHVEPRHFRTMLDCAQICQTSADFLLRGSDLHMHTCRACAEICEACALSCEEVEGMPECVDACRRCAESCRAMASAMAA